MLKRVDVDGQTRKQQNCKTHPLLTPPLCLSVVIQVHVDKGQHAVVDNVVALGGIGAIGLGDAALLYGRPPGA